MAVLSLGALDDKSSPVHNHREILGFKETAGALRKKAKAQEDSNPQAQEEEKKEQTQDTQIGYCYLANGHALEYGRFLLRESAILDTMRP